MISNSLGKACVEEKALKNIVRETSMKVFLCNLLIKMKKALEKMINKRVNTGQKYHKTLMQQSHITA